MFVMVEVFVSFGDFDFGEAYQVRFSLGKVQNYGLCFV